MADGRRDRRGWVQFGGTVVPNWVSAICAILILSGFGAGVHAVVSPGSSEEHEPTKHKRHLKTLFLGPAGSTESKPGSNTALASGVASISGAPFPKSVRQLY